MTSQRLLGRDATLNGYFMFILAEKASSPIDWMCQKLGVSRASYYRWTRPAVPGTRFCGDVTYLRTRSGWLYLATVIDLCTRMVVGWSMASHLRTGLIIDALPMARDHGCD